MARVLGFRPIFVDIDPITFNMDPAKLERAITPNTRAVVPTHLYGQPCDMDAIMSIARANHLAVIEDCAHALGATYKGRKVGTFGEAAFFSFQMLKPLNTYGGGMAITDNSGLASRIRSEAQSEPLPASKDVFKKIFFGNLQRQLIGPYGFTFTMYLAFFSHNIFTERYQLLAFAFFAMGGTAEAGQAVRDGLLRPLWAFAGRPVQAPYPTTVGMQ